MIKLIKRPEPDVLRQNKAQWTQEYKDAKAETPKNQKRIDDAKYKYRHPDIKDQIVGETHEKCAYCESKMLDVHPGEIEHIDPKSASDDDLFDWANLTLGCTICNSRKRAYVDDVVGIINPYIIDPEDHLYAAGSLIFPRPGDDIGKLADLVFDLNRPPLTEKRRDRLQRLQDALDAYANAKSPLMEKLYKKRLEDEQSEEKPYAMVSRAFIKLGLQKIRQQKASAKKNGSA